MFLSLSECHLNKARDVGSGVSWGLCREITAVPYQQLTFPMATTNVMASLKNWPVILGVPDTNLSVGCRIHAPLLLLIGNISLTEHTEHSESAKTEKCMFTLRSFIFCCCLTRLKSISSVF